MTTVVNCALYLLAYDIAYVATCTYLKAICWTFIFGEYEIIRNAQQMERVFLES